MPLLTDYTRRADTLANFTTQALWDLFDGDQDAINIAHECIDRHVGQNRIAIRIAYAAGGDDQLTFEEVSRGSARFAHRLAAGSHGVEPCPDRVEARRPGRIKGRKHRPRIGEIVAHA